MDTPCQVHPLVAQTWRGRLTMRGKTIQYLWERRRHETEFKARLGNVGHTALAKATIFRRLGEPNCIVRFLGGLYNGWTQGVPRGTDPGS